MSSAHTPSQIITVAYDPINKVELDAYVPVQQSTAAAVRALPAVIAFHGGGMTAGSKKDLFFPTYLIEKLLPRDIIFISANYSLLYPSSASDIIADVHTLFAYLSSTSSDLADQLSTLGLAIDAERLAVVGISGGNYPARAAATLTTVQPRPKAWLSLYGMANDFLHDHWILPNKAGEYIKTLTHDEESVAQLLAAGGGEAASDAPLALNLALRQAGDTRHRVDLFVHFQHEGTLLDYVLNEPGLSAQIRTLPHDDRSAHIPQDKRHLLLPLTGQIPPTYLIHGTLDKVVPIDESRTAYEDLGGAGVKRHHEWLEGADHGLLDPARPPNRIAGWEEAVDRVLAGIEGDLKR